MTTIKFCRILNDNGHAYDWAAGIAGGSHSYTDLWSLIRLSGFPIIDTHEVDFDSEDTVILFPDNGNSKAAFSRPHRCKLILWSLERPGTEDVPYADEIWVSDRYQHRLANNPKFRYVPMGGHPGLGGTPSYPILYDFAVMAYLVDGRLAKVHGLANRGFSIAPNAYGEPRDMALAHSRCGLCLHQTPHPIIEPLRYTLFACWRLPLVCEWSEDFFPYRTIPYQDTMSCLLAMESGHIQELVEENFETLTKRLTFRACVEQAVHEPTKEFQ